MGSHLLHHLLGLTQLCVFAVPYIMNTYRNYMCTQEQAHLHVVEQLKYLVYMYIYMYMYVSVSKYHILYAYIFRYAHELFSATLYVVHLHLIQIQHSIFMYVLIWYL